MSLILRTHSFVVTCESVIWHFLLGAYEVRHVLSRFTKVAEV